MHFLDPVAETIDDKASYDGVIRVERVATAGVVGVARAAGLEDVVGRVVDAAKAEGRPGVIAFRRVVEDDVKNDFNTGTVQRLDHVAEFIHRAEGILPRAIRLVRCEE